MAIATLLIRRGLKQETKSHHSLQPSTTVLTVANVRNLLCFLNINPVLKSTTGKKYVAFVMVLFGQCLLFVLSVFCFLFSDLKSPDEAHALNNFCKVCQVHSDSKLKDGKCSKCSRLGMFCFEELQFQSQIQTCAPNSY